MNAERISMGHLREAISCADTLAEEHAGLDFTFRAGARGVWISATDDVTEATMQRLLSWNEIDLARINVLTATVSLIADTLTAKAAVAV